MKQSFYSALRLSFYLLIICGGLYTLIVLGLAWFAPGHGKGEKVSDKNGRSYYANIGQRFDKDIYFNSRPSAVNYNAAGSGGSNKGPSDPEYLKTVRARANDFKVKNPGEQVPVDMVTASGSGLDPDITVEAARAQIRRIARLRQLKESALLDLINHVRSNPLLGPEKVNVLKLNIALDELK